MKHIDTVIAAIIGFYAIHLFTSYSGVGISPDSIMYASTANSIQAHWSLLTFNGTPLTFFPIFYPFFLGVIQFITRVNPFIAGSVINSCLFASVIFVTGWMLSRFIAHSNIYKLLILAAIILSPALLEIYSFLWSETLFILEVMLFILAYHHYMRLHSTFSLLIVVVIAAVACITRYAGITLAGAGGLMLLLDDQLTIRRKIKHLLILGLGSISLLAGNLFLNSLNTGLSTGKRLPSVTPFSQNLYYAGTVINDWGALGSFADHYAIPIAAVVLLSLIGILLFKTLKGKINSYENIVIAFTIVYGLFIILLATFSRFERINSRLLSPMFIPLLISCTSWVPDVIGLVKSKAKYVLSGVAIIMMLAFEYFTLQIDLKRYDDEMDYGVPGYSDDSWNTSPFIAFLRAHKDIFKPGIPVVTNADEAVYFFTGMSSTLVPHRYYKTDVDRFYEKKQYYYIWFKTLDNSELINIHDIEKVHQLKKLYDLKDGAIYEYTGEKAK
ncbi:hypothetical protein LJ658_18915 [Mucilaginibacter sp. UR6-11]|nr:hypothetical protein [Mucilaginibacter sp. UR6-11]